MSRVAVRIFHRQPATGAGPLERRLAGARAALADRHALAFRKAGADDVEIVTGPPGAAPFGARLRVIVRSLGPGGLVVLGSGGAPLATAADRREFVAAARAGRPLALANNRYSADVVAIACAEALADLPDLPSDNALPRWLEEVAGYAVADLRRRWRLQLDLDSPLDLVLLGRASDDDTLAAGRLAHIAAVAANHRAEVVVAGRTSIGALARAERTAAARVRALVEERGLRASSPLARSPVPSAPARPPRSVLGLVLDRDGPDALGARLAELGDAALVDTRVLLAHRLGADERGWPRPEDRYASDLLLADRIADPWLRALTASALDAPIPIVLGGHSLVGPGLRLALRARMADRAVHPRWT